MIHTTTITKIERELRDSNFKVTIFYENNTVVNIVLAPLDGYGGSRVAKENIDEVIGLLEKAKEVV